MADASVLRDIVGDDHIREGREGDALDGVTPTLVVTPGSVAEVGAVLVAAGRAGWRVAPRGAGTKLRLGNRPAGIDLVLDVSRLDRVLEHAAGDLVLSVEAGARLAAVQVAVGEAGQRLALDPPEADGTVGGIISANASGPRRYRYGTVRDLLIGVTVVLADGTVAKAGGKVVKNVAGYDLGKLMTGSLGTLAVIVGAIFRLHPRPLHAVLVEAKLPDAHAVQAAVLQVARSTLVPSAVQLSWPAGDDPLLAVLFEGSEASAEAQARQAVALLDTAGAATLARAPEAWERMTPTPTAPDDTTIRITCLRDRLAETLDQTRRAADEAGIAAALGGAAGNGILELRLFPADPEPVAWIVDRLRQGRTSGHVVVTSAPPTVKTEVDVWGPIGDSLPLMRRVKDRFDPHRILNPGRFVGGI